MTIELETFTRDRASEWNSLLEQSLAATLFHQWDWLEIASKYTKSRLYPLVVTKDSIPIGMIPLFSQARAGFRMVFSPPPHAGLFYLGPVLTQNHGKQQDKMESDYLEFHDTVEQFLDDEIKPNYTSISLPPDLNDPRPYSWAGYDVEPRYDYVTDLSLGEAYLFSGLPGKKRQGINRSKRRGVTVRIGAQKEFESVIDLMVARYDDQEKLTTIPREYFSKLYERFSENMTVFVAEYEGEIITGLIDLHYRDAIHSWIGNPRPRAENTGSPNTMIFWEAIKFGCAGGFKSYVTMSAAGNRRLHRFYSSHFECALTTRFHAKKTTAITSVLEKGYSSFVKPWGGKIQHLLNK